MYVEWVIGWGEGAFGLRLGDTVCRVAQEVSGEGWEHAVLRKG